MLILVEGLDRAGKTTRCRELMAEPRTRPRLMLHFVAPPAPTTPSLYGRREASQRVLDEIMFAYGLVAEHASVDFVLDRGHVSWLAYEKLLRGGATNVGTQRFVENLIGGNQARVEYVEVKDALTLARRDDGHSTYTPPKGTSSLQVLRLMAENIEREAAVFEKVLARTTWPVTRRVTG